MLSQSGDFLGWDIDQADKLIERLVNAIRTTIPIGLAVGFDNNQHRKLTPGQQNGIGRPLLVCMARVIDLAVDVIGEMRGRGDQIDGINLTFDDFDFFESIAGLVRRGILDEDLVWHDFFYDVSNYWSASREYIKGVRATDSTIWEDLDDDLVPRLMKMEARKQRGGFAAAPSDADVAEFLTDEKNLEISETSKPPRGRKTR